MLNPSECGNLTRIPDVYRVMPARWAAACTPCVQIGERVMSQPPYGQGGYDPNQGGRDPNQGYGQPGGYDPNQGYGQPGGYDRTRGTASRAGTSRAGTTRTNLGIQRPAGTATVARHRRRTTPI